MKKGSKIAVWIATGCVITGVALLTAGSLNGGAGQIVKAFDKGGQYRGANPVSGQEILHGDFERSFSAEGLRELELEAGCHVITMAEEDVDRILVEGKNCEGIQCYVQEDTLVLKGTGLQTVGVNVEEPTVRVTVPRGFSWEEAEVEADMGLVQIYRIQAARMEVGANMGAVHVDSFSAVNLEIDADMGAVELTGMVENNMKAESSKGSVTITLLQDSDEFGYEVEASLGKVRVDGRQIGNGSTNPGGASKKLELTADMGSIDIFFQ